jgi:hypothetical protein
MNAFCQVIQKQTATSCELYNHKIYELNGSTSFEFHGVANKYEYGANQSISVCERPTSGTSMEEVADISTASRLLKSLHFVFAASPIACTTKTKFDYFKTVIDNIFINAETKELFIKGFCASQRTYHILCNFANMFKRKRTPLRIQADLILNPIHESQPNVITIFQNGQKYLFTIGDLIRIIDNSLSNSYVFFSMPNVIKNPYNNMPFGKSILYSIYFCINQRNYVMSQLFHAYFLSNFNLKKFRNENEVLIRKMYITNYISKGNTEELYKSVLKMLNKSRFAKKILIDDEFPKEHLVEIMRPYLQLYFDGNYSLDMNIKYNSLDELHKRLYAFYKFNPEFGRKRLKSTSLHKGRNVKSVKYSVIFNDAHIMYKPVNSLNHYDKTHLGIFNEHVETVDNDNESESESENNEEEEATFSDDDVF